MQQLDLPKGPTTLAGLFEWPQYSAETLPLANFMQNAGSRHVLVNDAYSGTGTFSTSLHLVYAAMQREAKRQGLQAPDRGGVGMVSTRTSCDADSSCRAVLQSLHQDIGVESFYVE